MPRERRAPKRLDDGDVYDRPQHASATSPTAAEGGGGRVKLTLKKPAAEGGGKSLKLTLKRPSAGCASGASPRKRLKLKVPSRRGGGGGADGDDGGGAEDPFAELADPSASSARLPSRAAAAARREYLEGARTTKLTFKKGAERSEGNLPAATRLTLKAPAGSSRSSSKKRSRGSSKSGASAAAASASPARPAALRLALKPLTPTQRMRAVWRAVMDATDATGRRRAEIFERLPSPEELPMYYEVSASFAFSSLFAVFSSCFLTLPATFGPQVIGDPIDLDRIEAKLAMGEKQPGASELSPLSGHFIPLFLALFRLCRGRISPLSGLF